MKKSGINRGINKARKKLESFLFFHPFFLPFFISIQYFLTIKGKRKGGGGRKN